jgi:hypothetical protein
MVLEKGGAAAGAARVVSNQVSRAIGPNPKAALLSIGSHETQGDLAVSATRKTIRATIAPLCHMMAHPRNDYPRYATHENSLGRTALRSQLFRSLTLLLVIP